jgi:hypothetical protein
MLLLPDFDVFYGYFACRACVGSYFIHSGYGASTLPWPWPWVDFGMGLRCLGLLAGGCPAATHFSLLRQRKVSKRKATRLPGSLRFASGNLRCPKKTGVGANSLHCVALKQRAALIPFFRGIAGPVRTGQSGSGAKAGHGAWCQHRLSPSFSFSLWEKAGMRASGGRKPPGQKSDRPARSFPKVVEMPAPHSQSPHPNLLPKGEGAIQARQCAHAPAPVPVPVPAPVPIPAPATPVLTGPVMGGKSGIRAARCLSRRRVCADPRFCRSSQVARSEAKGPRQQGRLSFAYFSLAKQRKVSCRRATPGQLNQAKPAQHRYRTKPTTGTKP